MGRYNEIVACLDADPDDFEPIFLEGPEGEVIASDWAGGFLDAVALRATAWEPLIVVGIHAFWRNYQKPTHGRGRSRSGGGRRRQ
jgi:hypothetical protein